MKKTRFALLFLLIPIASFSQTFEKLKSDTQKIGDANYNMDFDVEANLTYPKVYEASGKSAFIEKLDSDYQNAEFRMRLEIVNPLFQYSEMKTIEGKKFYTITYKNPTRYFYEKKMDAATAQKNAATLKESAQAYEVVVEPQRNSINVKRKSKLIAVSDESTNGEWRFINLDDLSQRRFFETTFSSDVKKALGF